LAINYQAMGNKNILTRVFLVGCPRSGTTLLQSILAANSHVASFPETHFYEKLFSGKQFLAAFGIASRRARPQWKKFLEEIGHSEMQTNLPKNAIYVRQFSETFIQVLDAITLNQGKLVWIEKTPAHLHSVDWIERLVNRSLFIHILRNGMDNIASLYAMVNKYPETWGRWFSSIDQCIYRWVGDTRISRGCESRENHRLVSYEQLITDPKPVLVELCEFIRVPFEECMLTDYSKVAEKIILYREPWKASVREPISTANSRKSFKLLNEEQRQYILAHIPEDLLGNVSN